VLELFRFSVTPEKPVRFDVELERCVKPLRTTNARSRGEYGRFELPSFFVGLREPSCSSPTGWSYRQVNMNARVGSKPALSASAKVDTSFPNGYATSSVS